MKNVEIPREWEPLKELMQALIDMRLKISEDDFVARVKECMRVDLQPRSAQSDWVSQSIRDTYLAAIMRGRINIGS